jgi:hypothetical protein
MIIWTSGGSFDNRWNLEFDAVSIISINVVLVSSFEDSVFFRYRELKNISLCGSPCENI